MIGGALAVGVAVVIPGHLALAAFYAWIHRTPIRSWRDLLRLRKVWEFPVEDRTCTAVLEHWYISGRRFVYVDGELVATGRKLYDKGDRIRFEAGGHPCTMVFRFQGFYYRYNLAADGRWLDPVQSPVPRETPIWVIFFVGLCGGIPVATFGGAITTGMGLVGMIICTAAARARQPAWKRVAICALVTAVAWGLFIWMTLLRVGRVWILA